MKFMICALAVLLLVSPSRAETRMADAIAVIVNGAVITEGDIRSFIAPAVELLLRQYGRQPEVLEQKLNATRQDGTEQLVERQLILEDWKTAGYNLPESVIEDSIKERIREQFGDRVTLTRTLQARGITFERFRQQIRDEIIVAALRQKNVSSELIISPQKIEDYYVAHRDEFKREDQIKLRMIVVNHDASNAESTKRRLEEIRERIQGGSSFAEMAAIYSDGSQKTQGGDWGWVERSVLREDLAAVAFKLKPGEMSPVVETPTASYLMLVEQARPAHIQSLPEIREEIEKNLLAQERARLQKKYIDKLKAKSFIRYF